jgi:Ni/Co efflux regulator RcnB
MYRSLASLLMSVLLLAGSSAVFAEAKHKGAPEISIGTFFVSEQRDTVREYYGAQFKSGECPPGLAKKNKGCIPPGQAKKWALGQPLPSKVKAYSVPSALVARIGLPPAGHKYVRVDTDILLVALETDIVIDVISDFGGL